MSRKIVINEQQEKLLSQYILTEEKVSEIVKSKEFKDAVLKAVKDDRDLRKETESDVKEIVAKCMNELFKTLWQRNNFWKDIIKNA